MTKVTRWKRIAGRLVRDGHDLFPRARMWHLSAPIVHVYDPENPKVMRAVVGRGTTFRRARA